MKHASSLLIALGLLAAALPLEAATFELKEVKLKHGISVLYPDMLNIDDASVLAEVQKLAQKDIENDPGPSDIKPEELGVLFMATKEKANNIYMEQVLMIEGIISQDDVKAVSPEQKKAMATAMTTEMTSSMDMKFIDYVSSIPPDVVETNGLYSFQLAYEVMDQSSGKVTIFQNVIYTKSKTVILQVIVPTSFANAHLPEMKRILGSLKLSEG